MTPRLLAFDHDPVTREPTVEVAHEALIRNWPRLRGWLDEDRESLTIMRHLPTRPTHGTLAGASQEISTGEHASRPRAEVEAV